MEVGFRYTSDFSSSCFLSRRERLTLSRYLFKRSDFWPTPSYLQHTSTQNAYKGLLAGSQNSSENGEIQECLPHPLPRGVNLSSTDSESRPLPSQTPPPPHFSAVLAGSSRRGRPQPQRWAGLSSRPGGAAAATSSCRTDLQPCRPWERRRAPSPPPSPQPTL